MFRLLYKFDHISMFSAGKTFKSLFLRIHHQRRMMILVERAKSYIVGPFSFQFYRLSDHIFDRV